MTIRDFSSQRVFVEPPLAAAAVIVCKPEQTNYLRSVLRLDAGAELLVFNGRDGEWRAMLQHAGKRGASLHVMTQTRTQETGPDLWYLFAPLKRSRLDYMVQKAVEMGVRRLVPVMTAFEHFDVPHDGETRLVLSSKGAVRTATFALTARPGQIVPASNRQRPAAVEAGTLKGDYERARNRFAITEASLSVDRNHIDLQGEAVRAAELTNEGLALWHFAFVSTGGALAPAAPGGDPVKIDRFNVRGQLIPEAGRVVLQEMNFNAGGAAITAIGRISDLATDANRAAGLEARIAPMPLKRLLALWPSTIAPEARTWLATRLTKGQLTSGAFKLASTGDQPIALALEIGGAEIIAAPGLPPLEIPRALVRLEGGGLEVTIPDASIGAEGRRLAFKALRFTAVDTANGDTPFGEAAFRVVGPLATALDLADREPLRLLKSRGVVLQSPEGRLDGQFKITLPLADTLQASELRTEGRVRLTDVRVRQALGPHDLTGGKADIEISETAIDARGDFLVKGIPFKFSGQHFLNTTPDRQSPFRLTAKLDDADRTGLGLDINDLVSGEVPLEITLQPDAQGAYQARVTADLSKAELAIDSVAYRKPPGVTARVQFDPVKAAQGRTELREFKIIGDTIAAEGIITLGPDNKAKELSFPDFSLNVVTRLNVQGKLRPDHIWDVTAKGSTFDGRELFRDLFNVQSHPRPVPKDKPGLDLLAEIDTVLGFSDTNLKSVHLTLQRRNDNGHERTVSLDVSAKHDSGKPFEAHIRSTAAGERNLNAASQDAGQIFKTVGFYPNAMGGRMALEVALDGRGVVERNGVLKAEGFAIFGDPVVSEVFQNGEGGSTAVNRGPRRKVTREQFDFDWMVLPFSVGGCQFVMNDVQIKGPLVGATMRGKADFRSQRIQIGGTYVPLSGLNSAIGGLPIFGQILAGPKGEGIFGITFAIQGPMASPEVLVNPFSGFVPGILRETQQLTPDRFKITPCADPPTPAARRDGARASSAPPPPAGRAPSAVAPRAQPPDVLTDWTSDTKTDAKARTKPQPQAGN